MLHIIIITVGKICLLLVMVTCYRELACHVSIIIVLHLWLCLLISEL